MRIVPYLEVRPEFPLTTLAMSVDPRSYQRGVMAATRTRLRGLSARGARRATHPPRPRGPTPELRIEAELRWRAPRASRLATVQAADGSVHELVLGALGHGIDHRRAGVLPGASFLSLSLRTVEPTGPDAPAVRIVSINGRSAVDVLTGWEALRWAAATPRSSLRAMARSSA